LVQGIEINFDDLQGLFRSQTLDGQAAAATHKRNDKMPGRNGEFDSNLADETTTAGYQDGMSLGGHIGNILFRLRHSKEKRVTGPRPSVIPRAIKSAPENGRRGSSVSCRNFRAGSHSSSCPGRAPACANIIASRRWPEAL
jgi:hypothetical protein